MSILLFGMNKTILIGAGIVLAVTLGGFVVFGRKSPGSPATQTDSQQPSGSIEACAILTPEMAASALGTDVKLSTGPETQVQMKNITVTSCTYSSKNPATVRDVVSVSLLIRRATDQAEAKTIFDTSKQTFQGVDVSMQGIDGAYWSASLQQLNLLKGRDWYIITAGKVGTKTQEQAVKVADLILPKL